MKLERVFVWSFKTYTIARRFRAVVGGTDGGGGKVDGLNYNWTVLCEKGARHNKIILFN